MCFVKELANYTKYVLNKEKESVDLKLARDRVSKLKLEVVIDLGLNLIVKTSILL